MIPSPDTEEFSVKTWEGLEKYIDYRIMLIDANADWDDKTETAIATALKDELKVIRDLLG